MTASRPVLVTDSTRPGVLAALRELWGYRELVVELSKRSLQLRYKNSVLGIAWSLSTPLMLIFIITLVTKRLMNQNIPNYSAYLFPVMFAWSFFSMAIPESCGVLIDNAALVRKVYFPRELLPITVVVANLVHLLIAMTVALAYLALLRILPRQVNWQVLLLFLIIPAQCAATLGIGFIVSSLNVLFEAVRYVVIVAMQIMLYAVPILYPIERVVAATQHPWSHPWLDAWLRPHFVQLYLLNPFASILVLYQKALLPPIQNAGIPALPWSWGLLGQTWLISVVILVAGAMVFGRFKWTAVERL
ncbi:MAG: ABC transporter permease [Armatimonadetes bacterium]|nr:ABC transporter permease [Armatimonadota bacterium]